ncbi:phosphatidylinositol N-acetylglucosaminyltransferase subunit A-like [Sinocyclocheilus grahami]|uniref:phosphatidylinositol N-acetylglucosaminyltransferase subunit A-like n=1 Tax=Sinocyclocheilus grahami TaxID=75366 RepID=UPI0007AD095F|nr:PREDICTED: phosphatidylinositol N-acetylglucosaminyltransferase subunit A-like [Sinocyclocheilus grahami]
MQESRRNYNLETVIARIRTGNVASPATIHRKVRTLYTWRNVAERTEKVYNRVCREPVLSLSVRLHRLRSHCGAMAGSIFSFVAVINFIFLLFLQWLRPDHLIDVSVDSSGPHSRMGQLLSKKKSKAPNPALS